MLNDWILLSIVFTMIATPVVFAPLKLFDGYILPQMAMAAIGISVALIFYICNGVYAVTATSFLALFYFVYWMTTNSWSTINHSSIKDVPLIFATAFVFIIAITLFSNDTNTVGVSLGVFSIAMFTAFYGIGQKFLFDPLFPERLNSMEGFYRDKKVDEIHPSFRNKRFRDGRSISTIGNTNFACGFFISTLPFVFYLSFTVSSYFMLGVIPLLVVIVFTRSRNGALSLLAASLFLIVLASIKGLTLELLSWFYFDMNGLKLFVTELVVGLILLQCYIYLKSNKVFEKLAEEGNRLNDLLEIEHFDNEHSISTLRFRLRYWKAAVVLIKKRPISGFGLRTYRREVYGAQGKLHEQDGKFLGKQYQTPQPRECHNDFLENFVEGGLAGGFVIIVLISIVFYHGMTYLMLASEFKDVMLMILLLSSMIAFVINTFFAFPLRLASSAMNFWLSLALVESVSIKTVVIYASANGYLVVLVVLGLIAMLWESVFKPNLSNYYFTRYNFVKDIKKKERCIQKAIAYQPRDTIPRTHALLGYIDAFPDEASIHASVSKYHYDGMVPAWTVAFNSGLMKKIKKDYTEAVRLFSESLFYFPRFVAAKLEIDKIWHLMPYPKRSMIMKQISEEAGSAIKYYQEQINTLKEGAQKNELIIGQIILSEKLRLNVPESFLYEMKAGQFLSPREISEEHQVLEMGPTKIPILITRAAVAEVNRNNVEQTN